MDEHRSPSPARQRGLRRALLPLLALAVACGEAGGAPVAATSVGAAGSAGGGAGSAGQAGAQPAGGSGGLSAGGFAGAGAGGQAGAAGASGGAGGALDEAAFKAALAKRVCEAYAPRCQVEQRPFEAAFCEAYLIEQYEQLYGVGLYDPERAAQCLANSPDSLVDCAWVYSPAGTAAIGAPCAGRADCAPSPLGHVACVLIKDGDAYRRTCQRVLKNEGEDCEASVDWDVEPPFLPCAEGMYCDKQCTLQKAPGSPCTSSQQCAQGATCNTICTLPEQANEGESCGFSKSCAPGLWCQKGLCAAQKEGGAACSSWLECRSKQCYWGLCWSEVGDACSAQALSPEEQFQRKRISLQCQQKAVCCAESGRSFSQRWCELDHAGPPFISAPSNPPAGSFKPAAVDACLAQLAQQGAVCHATSNIITLPASPDVSETANACDAVYRAVPGAQPGEPCGSYWDCAQPESGAVKCEGGSCRQYLIGKLGDSCLDGPVRHLCDRSGLRCEEGICQPRLPDGAPCSGSLDCAQLSTCVIIVGKCPPGEPCYTHCQSPKIHGEPCETSSDCYGGRCIQGACAPLVPVGSPCDANADCVGLEGTVGCVNGVCRHWASATTCGP